MAFISVEKRRTEFKAHGKNLSTSFGSEVEISFPDSIASLSLTAMDSVAFYLTLKSRLKIGTLKVTLDVCFDFLPGSVGGGGLLDVNQNTL